VHDIDRYSRRPRCLHKSIGRFLPASLVAGHCKFQRGQVFLRRSGTPCKFDEILRRAADKRRLHDREYPDCSSHRRSCEFSLSLAQLPHATILTFSRMVTTNIRGLARVAPAGLTIRSYPSAQIPNRWLRNLRLYWSARRSGHLVIHFDLKDVAFFAVLFTFLPGKRCRLTTLDLFVGDPQPRALPFIRWCLRRVDRLLVYFRDTSHFVRLLEVPASRFHYVPFKINGVERIREITPTEDGYIFCGGRSRRDFRTLFEAVEALPYPVKVVTSDEAEMNPH